MTITLNLVMAALVYVMSKEDGHVLIKLLPTKQAYVLKYAVME
jgi:hypothetical protein